MPPSRRTIASGLAQAVLTAAGLAYVFWDLDLSTALESFSRYSGPALALVTIYISFMYAGPALRMRFLCRGRIGFSTAWAAVLLCLGVNNVLPARLGEAAKIVFLRRRTDMPLTWVLGVVFWERFFDLNVILILGVLVAVVLGHKLAMAALGGGVLAVWFLLVVNAWLQKPLDGLVDRIPLERVRAFVADMLIVLRLGFKPGSLAGMWATTFLALGLYAGSAWLFLNLVADLGLSPLQVVAVFITYSLATSLPSAPGGLGVYEAGVVMILGLFGIDKGQALPAALTLHALQMLPPLLALGPIMARAGLTLKGFRSGNGPAGEPASGRD
jgi:uncharacterized protein (TIRG00374 family)